MPQCKDKIRIVTLTDLHIGNARLEPAALHDQLRKFLYPKLTNNNIDILAIVGDFFDTSLSLNSTAGYHAILIAQELIELAKRESFFIRVDRGTFSHDRYQNQLFLQHTSESDPSYYTIKGEPLVKVANTITVEHINALNLDILYIPDDLPKMDVYETIEQQLAHAHLSKVDMIFSHGYFEHLLPKGIPHLPPNTLSQVRISKYVKGAVLNGHIHTASVYKNVVSGGSFCRFCHGEEAAKGFFIVEYDINTHKCSYEFIENVDTLWFKAVDISGLDVPTATAKYTSIVNTLVAERPAETIYIQLTTDDLVVKQALELFSKQTYHNVICTPRKTHTSVQEVDAIKFSVADLVIITRDNIIPMIQARLHDKGRNYTLEQIQGVIANVA